MTLARVDYRGTHWFPVAPVQLWDTVEDFDRFGSWWSWLREFRTDAPGLVPGNVLHGTVIPPVPYPLRLDVRLERCDRPRLLVARVEGDLRGTAAISFAPLRDGTEVLTQWSLDLASPALRVASIVAFPLLRWGHDRVVEMAVSGFRRRALS